jgi:hypothetical protein
MPTNFERFDSGLQSYGSVVKTSMTKFALESLLWMILMPKILATLDESPFESARSISERLRVGRATVLEYLNISTGFKSFHLRWVQHLLTDDLRQKWKEHANAMLPFLHIVQLDGWHHLVTGDESWFFLNTSRCRTWTLSRGDVATKPRLDIQSKNSCF